MKISIEFDSWKELTDFAREALAGETVRPEDGQRTKKEDAPEEEASEASGKDALEDKDESAPRYTLTDVRAKLAEIQKSGRRDEVRALLASVGADRLSDVPEERYPELMQKAGEL